VRGTDKLQAFVKLVGGVPSGQFPKGADGVEQISEDLVLVRKHAGPGHVLK